MNEDIAPKKIATYSTCRIGKRLTQRLLDVVFEDYWEQEIPIEDPFEVRLFKREMKEYIEENKLKLDVESTTETMVAAFNHHSPWLLREQLKFIIDDDYKDSCLISGYLELISSKYKVDSFGLSLITTLEINGEEPPYYSFSGFINGNIYFYSPEYLKKINKSLEMDSEKSAHLQLSVCDGPYKDSCDRIINAVKAFAKEHDWHIFLNRQVTGQNCSIAVLKWLRVLDKCVCAKISVVFDNGLVEIVTTDKSKVENSIEYKR